jgi:hypothetical protein
LAFDGLTEPESLELFFQILQAVLIRREAFEAALSLRGEVANGEILRVQALVANMWQRNAPCIVRIAAAR